MIRAAWTVVVLLTLGVACGCAAQQGLVGHWRFDTAGPQVPDLSGKGHSATVTGGRVVTEDGKQFLRLDGKTRIEVPSAPDLNLRRGFSIETRLRPSDITDGRLLVFKNDEYLLRIDWPVETSRLSFFVNLDKAWEPRVSAPKLPLDTWYHIVAIWDGAQSLLWVNGLPQQATRHGGPPVATANPLLIGTDAGFGKGFVGDIEYVKIFARALTSSEVITAAYGAGGKPVAPLSTADSFDFRQGLHGWTAREGATIAASPAGLVTRTTVPTSMVLHDNLDVDVSRRDYLSLRMAVDQGSRGTIVFITTKGAGRIPFPTCSDGAMHTYVLEPWQTGGWDGKLLTLGVVPAEVGETAARIQYVRVTDELRAEGELRLLGVVPEASLPRAGRPERITARLSNIGGPTGDVQVALRVPAGVELQGSATQTVPRLGYQGQQEVSWVVRAPTPVAGSFQVTASGTELATATAAADIRFAPALNLPKADYVPEPVPAKMGKYEVWTHYCPLWKHGTHTGWKAIEPYPERKPMLGWYDEGTPEVADWHIKYWLEHGISGVVYCWYRSNLNGPVKQSLGHAIHDGLLKARYLPQIKFAIMWENGCGKGVGSAEDLMDNVLPFWLDNYFTNPSYLKVDGKPLLYIWVPGNVTKHLGGSDKVRATFEAMRAKCRERGLGGLYIVGCVGGADKSMLEQMAREGWDASSAYGNGWVPPAKLKSVGSFVCAPYEGFIDQQEAIWKAKQDCNLLPDITAAMMGWDSRPWNETSFFWSDNTPEKFRDLCLRARKAMDAKPGGGVGKTTAIFCCWNEFGEGHYIEPTRGYGFSYLDVIRDVFSESPGPHTDLAPEDVGLGPYDSWYREARAAAPVSAPSARTSWGGDSLRLWTGSMGLAKQEFKDGVLRMVSDTADPAMSCPPLALRASRFTQVVVDMRVSQAGGAQLFWSTVAVPNANEPASISLQTVADGQFHRYVFEVGRNEYWGGCVKGLRFDPASAEGVTIEIRGIEVK